MNNDKDFDKANSLLQRKSLRSILTDLRKAELWLMVAAFAAFMASAFFVVKYFVGGEMSPSTWTGEQWANAGLGLGITAVITAAQAFLYSSGNKGLAAIAGTVVVVFFGLFSEVSQSMEREDETVRSRSEASPVFQAALNGLQNINTHVASNPYADDIANAQMKYNQCLERLAQGKEKHCEGSKGRLESYQQQAAEYAAQASSSNTATANALFQQAKALEYDEDKHYAMIRLLQDMFNVGGIWASFIFSLIIIGTFEYAFHFVGSYVADHKRALLLLGRDTNGELLEQPEQPEQQKPEIKAAPSPAPVQPQNEVIDLNERRQPQPAPAPQPSYREHLRNGGRQFQDTALDAPLNPISPVATASSALEKAQQRWNRPAPPATETVKHTPPTVSKNTVSIQQVTVPDTVNSKGTVNSSTVGTVKLETVNSNTETVANSTDETLSDDLYRNYRSAVLAGQCKPTVRPTAAYFKKAGMGGSNASRSALAQIALERLLHDGIIERDETRSDKDPRGPYRLIGKKGE